MEYETMRITDAAGVLIHRAVVLGSTAGDCAKPGAANAGKFAGITQEAQATQNRSVRVKTSGRTFATAAGTIAVGDYVGIADTAGKLASNQTAAVATPGSAGLVYVVGIAKTAATDDGDIFEMEICPFLVKTAAS